MSLGAYWLPTGAQGAEIEGPYRYALWRTPAELVRPDAWVLYIGANPSTADAVEPDATVRLWNGHTQRNGFGRWLAGNVYAYRSKDPKGLKSASDPVGPYNQIWIERLVELAAVVVCCWGDIGAGMRANRVEQIVRSSGHVPMALGVTSAGVPRHPRGIPRSARFRPLDELRDELGRGIL